MRLKTFVLSLIVFTCTIGETTATSSPLKRYANYTYSTQLEANIADLWWTVDALQQEITFELHIKTTGWIALGISPAGGMLGADIGLGWVDAAGKLTFEDRYAFGNRQPIVDNTTVDWFGLQGREENGWTAIQFKRALDTCDTMDVPIKSGTNILIFAYGLEDPTVSNGQASITYHEGRRGSRIIPLQSYGNPPPESKFAGLDYFDFRLNNYAVPAADTAYHCKIHRVPKTFTERRHAIAYQTIVDPNNRDLVHHLLMYECNSDATFDDDNLPDDLCDNIAAKIRPCAANIASGWAVGGDDIVEFPEVAGYPVGGDFEIKYYLVQMHYDNPKKMSNRTDSSGIRFYIGNEIRQHEIGYYTLGTETMALGVSIPPRVDKFIIDSYCPAFGTKKFPESGITVISAFPHTHLQGRSLWTKIIRNKTAVQYLFNAASYDFNYQFVNQFPEPIKLYPGDEFATRCVYSTTNKAEVTLGGESTKEEMCLHMFTYYPRMKNVYMCLTFIPLSEVANLINGSMKAWNFDSLNQWLQEREWTPERAAQWQELFNKAPRSVTAGGVANFDFQVVPGPFLYEDLKPTDCQAGSITAATTTTAAGTTTKTTTTTTRGQPEITTTGSPNGSARTDMRLVFTVVALVIAKLLR